MRFDKFRDSPGEAKLSKRDGPARGPTGPQESSRALEVVFFPNARSEGALKKKKNKPSYPAAGIPPRTTDRLF